MTLQLALFYAPVVHECTCGSTIESGRLCEACRIEHRRESKRKYSASLWEDADIEIPYNAINERWECAEYEMIETIGQYARGSHWTVEDMIVARNCGDLPYMTQLIDLRNNRNYTLLGLIGDTKMSLDAYVTVKFKMVGVCNPEDLLDDEMTFEEMVKYLIKEESLVGVVEDEYEILSVEQIP